MIKTFASTAMILLCALSTTAQDSTALGEGEGASTGTVGATLVDLRKIWTPEKHCMSTDLVRYRDQWFCRFQDSIHLVDNSKISIIRSADGRTWKSGAQLSGCNLPCSRFTVKPDEQLMLFSATDSGEVNAKYQPVGWFSRDGVAWTKVDPAIEGDLLMHRLFWHQDKWWGFASGYRTQRGRMSLYTTQDGTTFKEHVPSFSTGFGFDPSIAFGEFGKAGTAICVVPQTRLIETIKPLTHLGSATAPHQEWKWKELDAWLVGPTMIQLPNGDLLVAGRQYDYSKSLAFPKLSQITIWLLDPESGKLTELLLLPSGTDLFTCGSPGLAWHDSHVWISYNSSHELDHSKTETAIYLAKVRITEADVGEKRRTRR